MPLKPRGSAAKPQVPGAPQFSEGLAATRVRGLWGYVNESGRLAIGASFDAAGPFCRGLAVVVRMGVRYYIDKTGRILCQVPSGQQAPTPSVAPPKLTRSAVPRKKRRHRVVKSRGPGPARVNWDRLGGTWPVKP